jgi:hypothetical protein
MSMRVLALLMTKLAYSIARCSCTTNAIFISYTNLIPLMSRCSVIFVDDASYVYAGQASPYHRKP